MTPEEITALAREYAEEMCAHMIDDFIKDEAIRDIELAFQMIVEHLSRRYCLVEKEKARKWIGVKLRLPEIRERVLICERVANQYKVFIGRRVPSPCPDGWEWNQSTKESVVAWMPLPQYIPEIAKEVEG